MLASKFTPFGQTIAALVTLSGGAALLLVAQAAWGWVQYGALGVSAAGAACGVCWLAGMLALGSGLLWTSPAGASLGLFFGMLIRLGIPLVCGLHWHETHSPLLGAAVVGQTIVAYQVLLLLETVLACWVLGQRDPRLTRSRWQWAGLRLPGMGRALPGNDRTGMAKVS